jgi:hypothetical protein
VLVGLGCALVLSAVGSASSKRALLSIEAATNPVPTAGCLASGCSTYLNPAWTFDSSDVSYTMINGMHTSSVACFAIHSDLGTFAGFSGGSGVDTSSAPQGAPETGGSWRTWCYNGLPTHVQGASQASIPISSTQAGTADITAYLLRYGQLSEGFAQSVIAEDSFKLVFGSGALPVPKQTGARNLDWSLSAAAAVAVGDKVGPYYLVLGSLHASGSAVTSGKPLADGSEDVVKVSGTGRWFFYASETESVGRPNQTFGITVRPTGARYVKTPQGVGLLLDVTISPTRLEDADLECLAHPDGTLTLIDGLGATPDAITLHTICGVDYTDTSSNLHVTIREQ